jgi:hypothetical protein
MMNERRKFMRLAAALPMAAIAAGGSAEASGLNTKDFCGAWTTMHTLPGGEFREFLVFAAGGALTETNALLHTSSHLSIFAEQFRLPLPADVNASDGMGSWEPIGPGQIRVGFRKLLFDGGGMHLGDFRVQGRLRLDGERLFAEWDRIWIETDSGQEYELGTATSEGTRIV